MNTWGTTPGQMRITEETPFMAKVEYEYIRDWINNHKLKTALEWGAGSSTLWFSEQCNVEKWTAIEHDPNYYNFLLPKINSKVDLQLKETEKDYIEVKGSYDFILIDGMYRDQCLQKAFKRLSSHPQARIFVHDAGRKAYKEWYGGYQHEIVYPGEGWLGDGWDHRGLAVFPKQ